MAFPPTMDFLESRQPHKKHPYHSEAKSSKGHGNVPSPKSFYQLSERDNKVDQVCFSTINNKAKENDEQE